ncbi:hypothetical protein BGW39_004325 [Mortierella sp. 14UC]|nr:hypothetical protein BGW39_004325 [Mortierella sp. 14UC]
MDPAETITATAAATTTATASVAPQPPPSTLIPLVGQAEDHQQQHSNNNDKEKDFPVRVTILPNKGRSFVATRNIQPQELVFVAEVFGTTMCDPWLDCGICHYCWAEIRDPKAQILVPSFTSTAATTTKQGKQGRGEEQETVMVFCDEACWRMYGPDVADMICRVEEKIRRTWADSGVRHWKVRTEERRPSCKEVDANIVGADTSSMSSSSAVAAIPTASHYSELIQQALDTADTKQGILELNDQDLARFLDITWSAFDGLISEQESWIQHATTTATTSTTTDSRRYIPAQSHSHTQAQCEALFPKLAKLLLEGNNHATIATRTSDDDCETIRLVSEVLYRRQLDLEAAGAGNFPVVGVEGVLDGQSKAPAAAAVVPESLTKVGGLRGGRRAMFEDYCAMQSNELILFRQQVKEDLDSLEDQESDEEASEDEQDEQEQDTTHDTQSQQQQQQQLPSCESKHDTDMAQWRQLLSILPNHLLSCFYVYLRIRDAYLLLARENATLTIASNPDTPQPTPHQQQQQRPTIALTITSTLFRTILYREVANSFGIRDASDELLAFAVFPRACFFNHSCRPNILKKRRLGYVCHW